MSEEYDELEKEIEQTRQEVRDCLDKLQRRRLMRLVDSQNLLKEEISLASFTAFVRDGAEIRIRAI